MSFKHTPEEARKLWVNDLRHGGHEQIQGELCSLDSDGNVVGYCCLGVACELYQEHVGGLNVNNNEGAQRRSYDGAPSVLPRTVADWLGLCGVSGEYQDDDVYGDACDLAELNDDMGWSFEKIADLIEQEPDGLIN